MAAADNIVRDTLAAQARFFRIAERDYGLTRKALHIDTGIPMATLASYAGDTMMPLAALNKLSRQDYPDELLSILTEPGTREIVTPADGGDFDALAREAAGFTAEKLEADADGKREPAEIHKLRHRARRLGSLAAAAA